MDEKETTQVVEGETSQSDEGTTQPTVEELQGQLAERDREIERKEGVLQQTKRELKEARQRGGSKAEIEALGKRLETQEEFLANALDDIANRVGGDYEEQKQTRKSYSDQLKERRQVKTEQPKPDPEAQKFLNYCEIMDLHLDYEDLDGCDPMVKEALEGRDFREATKYLKEKMKPQEVDIDKKVDEKLQIALEQKLKDMGLTKEGAGAPSGPNVGFDKSEQDYVEGKISYMEYKKLRQEKGLD